MERKHTILKKITRKLCAILILTLSLGCLQACHNAETKKESADVINQSEQLEESELLEESKSSEEPEDEESTQIEGMVKGKKILEDDEFLYAVGRHQISKISKIDNKTIILWDNWNGEEPGFDIYAEGKGILFCDRIYFLEDRGDETKVSMVNTDGTCYMKLLEAEVGSKLLLEDNTLYTYHYSYVSKTFEGVGYVLKEDGSLDLQEKQFPYNFACSDELRVIDFNTNSILCRQYYTAANEDTWYLMDRETRESTVLTVCDTWTNFLEFNDEYLYTLCMDEESGDYVYVRVSLQDGEFCELFRQSMLDDNPEAYWTMDSIMNYFVIQDGYIYYKDNLEIQGDYLYYPDMKDYKMFMMRRSFDSPKETEMVGETYFDTGIENIGKLEEIHEEIYSEIQEDVVIYCNDILYLVVDERFEGADKINSTLYDEECIVGHVLSEDAMEFLEGQVEENGYCGTWSDNSYPSRIYYFDENYLSFFQTGDCYRGGAHGMLWRCSYTFDLHTGEELTLSDIIGNSEEELKEIVIQYFTDCFNENPDVYWSDAIETVSQRIGFDSYFYLTNAGVVFYYEPYALACFAEGFQQVTIPYSALKMKIDLQLAE